MPRRRNPRYAPVRTDTRSEAFQPHADRFWEKVHRRGPDDCWPWMSSATGMGYGRIKIDGKVYSAHRVAYALAHGDIPSGHGFHGTVIRHTCDNKACCNPAHLVAGTQRANAGDMSKRGRGGRRVLSCADVEAIRNDDRSQKVIAAEYGIVESTVWKIRAGHLWKPAA